MQRYLITNQTIHSWYLFILGNENFQDTLGNVLNKFEKIENDVYTEGCEGIQPFEPEPGLGRGNQITSGDSFSEDMSKKDSSFSSDVHILILEESNIPDLESVSESKTVTSQSSDDFEDKETVMIEDYSEHPGFIDNDSKDIPIIDSDDIQDNMEDNESKDISPVISSGIVKEQGKNAGESERNDEQIEFIEYFWTYLLKFNIFELTCLNRILIINVCGYFM